MRFSLMLTGLMVAAAFQATPASQPRFVARQSSTAHSDLGVYGHQASHFESVICGDRMNLSEISYACPELEP